MTPNMTDSIRRIILKKKKAWEKAYRERNKEKVSDRNHEWRQNNMDKVSVNNERWRKAHMGHSNHLRALGHKRTKERTPAWADLEKIKEFYIEAQQLTKETGIEHHVDHKDPLNGELISGLHVEDNLQVIPAHDNLTKSNSFNG